MFSVSLPLFAFFWLLAGRVSAFSSIAVGSRNVDISDLLTIPASPVATACNSNITAAAASIQACNTDPTCLCNADTLQSLLSAETCMFHFLVDTNAPMPDFRAGSNPVLSGYAAACKAANITLLPEQTALTLPPAWDGPFDAILPVGGAAVAVMFAGILGISALLLLSNM